MDSRLNTINSVTDKIGVIFTNIKVNESRYKQYGVTPHL